MKRIVLIVALAACDDSTSGGGTPNDGGNNGTATGVDSASTLSAVCDYFERCAGTVGRLFVDRAACEATLRNMDACGANTRFHNTQAEVDACNAYLSGRACTGLLFMDNDRGFEQSPCTNLRFRANEPVKAAVGESCEDVDCKGGGWCEARGGGQCDICRALGAQGTPCTDDYECAEAFFCDVGGTDNCEARLANGQPCNGDNECQSSLCGPPPGGGGDQCLAPNPVGGDCAGGGNQGPCADAFSWAVDCIGGFCADTLGDAGTASNCNAPFDCKGGLACDTGPNDCVAYTACDNAGSVGEVCVESGDCAADHYCRFNDFTCQARRLNGETCGAQPCVAGHYCDGTCQPFVAQDGPCTDSFQCTPGLICWTGNDTCTAPRPNGDACQNDEECVSMNCPGTNVCADPVACTL